MKELLGAAGTQGADGSTGAVRSCEELQALKEPWS